MAELMIEARDLRRVFRGSRTRGEPVVAVDGISFAVERGEIFGFLGPNGAGKTTTVNMLTGQLRPTGGWGRVAGFDIVAQLEHIKPLIGVVFEEPALYERMSGRANLEFFCALHGVDKGRVWALLEAVGLADRADDRVKTYSQGMKQRLAIARALLNDPQVLFLDEPTRGLDPAAARAIREDIVALRQRGVTVFLTTHYMEEADQLCDRVAFIDQGRIVALDTPSRLKLELGERRLWVGLRQGKEVWLRLDDPGDARRLEQLIVAGDVLTIHSQEATLEDVFIALTGHRLSNDR